MNIPDSKLPDVLNGIDKISTEATAVFQKIPAQAFENANINTNANTNTVRAVKEQAPKAATPSTKKPTI